VTVIQGVVDPYLRKLATILLPVADGSPDPIMAKVLSASPEV